MFYHHNGVSNLGAARFLVRWILGVIFVMAGYWKVFVLGADQHVQRFFVEAFADSWIPVWLLTGLGYVIPWWELAAGVLLLLGLRVREVAFSLGILLIITTYGHALMDPLFDIDGHTFTRLALVIFVLIISGNRDLLSLDAIFDSRHGSRLR